jgi:hypothetical protein
LYFTYGGLASLKLPIPGSDNFSDKGMHAQWPHGAMWRVTDTTAGCPCLILRHRRQSGREVGITERERKGDITQGHMDRSGGGGATWHALLCVDRFFLSSRIGYDLHDRRLLRACCWRQRKGKGGETKTKEICDWRKLIRIIFGQSTILPNFLRARKKILFFYFYFFSLAETTPLGFLRALAEVRLRFSF